TYRLSIYPGNDIAALKTLAPGRTSAIDFGNDYPFYARVKLKLPCNIGSKIASAEPKLFIHGLVIGGLILTGCHFLIRHFAESNRNIPGFPVAVYGQFHLIAGRGRADRRSKSRPAPDGFAADRLDNIV